MKKEKRFEGIDNLPESAPVMYESRARKEETNTPSSEEMAEAFTGELNLRIPKSLYQQLREEAKAEGVAITEYILYKLTR